LKKKKVQKIESKISRLQMCHSRALSHLMPTSKIAESKRLTNAIRHLEANPKTRRSQNQGDPDRDLRVKDKRISKMILTRERPTEELQETTVPTNKEAGKTRAPTLTMTSMVALTDTKGVAEGGKGLPIQAFRNLWPQEKSLSNIKKVVDSIVKK
jgi:hypothetical protein